MLSAFIPLNTKYVLVFTLPWISGREITVWAMTRFTGSLLCSSDNSLHALPPGDYFSGLQRKHWRSTVSTRCCSEKWDHEVVPHFFWLYMKWEFNAFVTAVQWNHRLYKNSPGLNLFNLISLWGLINVFLNLNWIILNWISGAFLWFILIISVDPSSFQLAALGTFTIWPFQTTTVTRGVYSSRSVLIVVFSLKWEWLCSFNS